MKAGEVCIRQVQTIGKDALLLDAARQMREFHVGDLIVIEEHDGRRIPVGILTDRDIVVGVAAEDLAHLQSLLVGDVLLPELVTAKGSDSIHTALKTMRTHGIRRLPIVDEGGGLCGILSVDDILGILAEELADLVKIIARAQQRERATKTSL